MTVHDVLLLLCVVCDCVPHQVWVEVFTMLLSSHHPLIPAVVLPRTFPNLRTWELIRRYSNMDTHTSRNKHCLACMIHQLQNEYVSSIFTCNVITDIILMQLVLDYFDLIGTIFASEQPKASTFCILYCTVQVSCTVAESSVDMLHYSCLSLLHSSFMYVG